jgi:hypothetical protein
MIGENEEYMRMVKTQEGDPLREADTGLVLTLQRLRSVSTARTNVHKTASRAQLVSHVGETSYDIQRTKCVSRKLRGDNKWLVHSQQCMANTKPAEEVS